MRENLEQARRFHEPRYEAEALTILGIGYLDRDETAPALPLLRRAMALAEDVDPMSPQVVYGRLVLAVAVFHGRRSAVDR